MGVLEGRKAIVTGGGAGIGAAICHRFAAEGASVAVLDRRADAAEAVAREIGGRAFAFTCDVASSSQVDEAVAAAARTMGGLTDLVNNAGMGMNKPLHRYRDEEWALVLAVNLTGTFHCMRAAIPHLLEAGSGSIVNNASLNGLRPLPGEAPYSAAKAGVINLTMTAASEYAPHIRVNCVSPGLIETPLTAMVTGNPAWRAAAEAGTPMARIGDAQEVADVVVFLASDAAGYVTGQNIVIDGGAGMPSLQADGLLRAIMTRDEPPAP
jgi:3-oxoacyl-[acyl-carrier protein] reductase/meso-butanediol dehydrogenase/(S,S)-butanediol dehydrogenase/diacetyl reductase